MAQKYSRVKLEENCIKGPMSDYIRAWQGLSTIRDRSLFRGGGSGAKLGMPFSFFLTPPLHEAHFFLTPPPIDIQSHVHTHTFSTPTHITVYWYLLNALFSNFFHILNWVALLPEPLNTCINLYGPSFFPCIKIDDPPPICTSPPPSKWWPVS